MANSGSLKSTIAVSLTNYLDAGAIVAGASGLTLWQNYLGLTEVHLGWLNFISANCLGAAIGAIIGGFLADKYGRKFIFTYNLLVYMTGVLLVMLSTNFPMLLAGFLVTGISVGVGVPASWTYISESSEVNNRGRNICISQMSWGFGPMCILLFGMLFAPGGYLFGWVESVAHMFGGRRLSMPSRRALFSSPCSLWLSLPGTYSVSCKRVQSSLPRRLRDRSSLVCLITSNCCLRTRLPYAPLFSSPRFI